MKEDSWDELLRAAQEVPENFEDLTSQPGPSPPAEVPTEPLREPKEPSRDDLDVGMEAIDPVGGSKRNQIIKGNRRAINFVEET